MTFSLSFNMFSSESASDFKLRFNYKPRQNQGNTLDMALNFFFDNCFSPCGLASTNTILYKVKLKEDSFHSHALYFAKLISY